MSLTQGGDLPATPPGNGAHPPSVIDEGDGFWAIVRGQDAAQIAALWAIRKDMLVQRRIDEAEACRQAHYRAKAEMQPKLPIVTRNKPNPNTGSKYSPLEQVWHACCPVWAEYGFVVSFDVITHENGWLQVLCYVDGHGHRETYTNPPAPPDDKGIKGSVNKTLVQGNQATITYAKRGVLCNAMGIVTENEDDDGNGGSSRDGAEGYERHTRQTGSREHEHRPPPWRPTLLKKLEATSSYEAWLALLTEGLGQAPSVTEIDALKKAIWPFVKKQDSPKMERDLANTFKDAVSLLNERATATRKSDGSSDESSDAVRTRQTKASDNPVLPPDEQWAQERVSEFKLLADVNTLMVIEKDEKFGAEMMRLRKDNPSLFKRVNDAYHDAANRLRRSN